MLAVLVILGGSLSVFAKPPRRAQVYGAIYGGDGTIATRNLKIAPINNNVFGLYQDSETYELCTNLYMYFLTDTASISSFRLRFRLLSTAFQLRDETAQSSANKQLITMNASTGAISQYINIKNSCKVTVSVDENGYSILEYLYFGESVERNAISLTIPFQNFMLGETPMYWEVVEFSINGESTALTYSEQQLSEINDTLQDDSTYYQPSTEIPSPDASHIGDGGSFASSALNDKLGLFDLSGAVQRTLVPIGTYLFTPNSFGDSTAGHTAIVAISTISMALLVIVWIINSLHRSRGWIE